MEVIVNMEEYLRGRASVWKGLFVEANKQIELEREIQRQMLAQLKNQEDNNLLINNQAAKIRHLEEQAVAKSAETFDTDKKIKEMQSRYILLLEMCMITNNLTADQRLYAIRNEHKPEWEAYKASTRTKKAAEDE